MSEKQFFDQVGGMMRDYSAEVPASVYQSMRRKLWWSRFTALDMSRLNIWYCVLAVGVALTAISLSPSHPVNAKSAESPVISPQVSTPMMVSSVTAMPVNVAEQQPSSCSQANAVKPASCFSNGKKSTESLTSAPSSSADVLAAPQSLKDEKTNTGEVVANGNTGSQVGENAAVKNDSPKKFNTLRPILYRDKK